MGFVSVKISGDYSRTTKLLNNISKGKYLENKLKKYGEKGVKALSEATPVDTGKTAKSWDYQIVNTPKGVKIVWTNSNTSNNIPIAIFIQYGHATRNGGFVQGRDFINPAMRPIFDQMADDVWREVTAK